ncbi:uncharacterized protein LOC128395693 [Panonychus citri]|uniref:uncharacterized protein LOC128395693 n=1 Tax=Panonychus citri TaxID=50023 RepID=UPI0023076111|nr:uncharacterized protein LOC128395693 [Panonychus citri]
MFNKLKSKLTNYFENNLIEEENLISKVKLLEKMGNFFQCTGYQQLSKLSTFTHTFHTISHLWYFVVFGRSLALILSDDPLDSLYLGDFFSSTSGKNFLHANLIVYYLLFFSSRAGVHIQESGRPQAMFTFYNTIKTEGFTSIRQLLSSADYYTWRSHFYLAIQFYLVGIPAVALSLFMLCLVFALENPSLYLSVYHFLWYFFWLILITAPLCFNVFILFFYYTHTMTLLSYLSLSLAYVNSIGLKLVHVSESQNLGDHLRLLRFYLKNQNFLMNLIRFVNSNSEATLWTGYLISCFLADFSLFLGLFVDSDSKIMSIISFYLACTAFSNLLVLHHAGTEVHNRLMDIRQKNFSLQARGIKILPESIALWINSTQERFQNGEIGITICHIFATTQTSLLYFVLENSGILMMFVANFKKS